LKGVALNDLFFSYKMIMGVLTEVPTITTGKLRCLTSEEKGSSHYLYVVLRPFKFECNGYEVEVPRGFITDGSSGGPDYGTSWLFHDYLYASHKFTSGQKCTRKNADEVMRKVLKSERLYIYCWIFAQLARINPLYKFSKAWTNSGKRGIKILSLE